MENNRYMQEGVDGRKLFLRFVQKLWLVLLAVVLGAALGAGIYLLGHLVFAPEREYQAVSKVYLNFNCEPEDYGQLAYNGYTWNDLMDTDPILDYTMEALPEGIEREEVIAATEADILSDIRLLTVTVTTPDRDRTSQIMEATQESLLHLGDTDEVFKSIEIYSAGESKQVVWDNRVVRAAVTGLVLGLFAVLFGMGLYYALDDSVYVEADVERNYGLPVFGIFTAGEPGTFQSYGNEFLSHYTYLCRGLESVALVSVDSMGDAYKAAQTMEKVLSTGKQSAATHNLPMAMPDDNPSVYAEIRKTGGVLLVVRYGRGNGRQISRMLSSLEKQDCPVLGVLVVEADAGFLKNYYRMKKEKRQR